MGLRVTPYGIGGGLAVVAVVVVVMPVLLTGRVAGRDPMMVPKAALDAVTLPPVPPLPPVSTAVVAVPDLFAPPMRDRRLVTDWSSLPPPPPFVLPPPSPLPAPEK
jgi:hypothetical protein